MSNKKNKNNKNITKFLKKKVKIILHNFRKKKNRPNGRKP